MAQLGWPSLVAWRLGQGHSSGSDDALLHSTHPTHGRLAKPKTERKTAHRSHLWESSAADRCCPLCFSLDAEDDLTGAADEIMFSLFSRSDS